MSLAIRFDDITHVLLADGWHEVTDASFDTDSYEFFDGGTMVIGGGQVDGVPSTGATWVEPDGAQVWCPLTAVLAVKQAKTTPRKRKRNG